MFAVFYGLVLHLIAICYAPFVLFQMAFRGKYRKNILQRLGFRLPRIDKDNRFLVWVHAASLGETKAIAPLVKTLKTQMPEIMVVVSSVTETGHKAAVEAIPGADKCFYLPFDLPYMVKPLVNAVKPDLIILSETDFWYNFLKEAKERFNTRIVVVNGKISERSLRRFNILPWLMAPLFQLIDLVCPQNEDYKERFLQLAIPPDHLYVTGNLKLDDTYPVLIDEEVTSWKERLGLVPGDVLLVIGSTHDPEEKQLLHVLKKVWKKCPRLKVALAPRHPERFKTVAALFEKVKIPFALYSAEEKFTDKTNLLLFDAMGILRQLYQIGDIAIVAGSFTDKVGGHNLLEPSWYGKPVLFGPHTESQTEMALLMKKSEAGRGVPLDKLSEELLKLIKDPSKRAQMGEAGVKIFAESRGATEKTWQLLRVLISQVLWEKANDIVVAEN